jgi:hypothetical protein
MTRCKKTQQAQRFNYFFFAVDKKVAEDITDPITSYDKVKE